MSSFFIFQVLEKLFGFDLKELFRRVWDIFLYETFCVSEYFLFDEIMISVLFSFQLDPFLDLFVKQRQPDGSLKWYIVLLGIDINFKYLT